MVVDGELVATVADEAVVVRDDADVEEVVAQVGVGDAIALAAEPDSVSAASFCRSDPVVDSNPYKQPETSSNLRYGGFGLDR